MRKVVMVCDRCNTEEPEGNGVIRKVTLGMMPCDGKQRAEYTFDFCTSCEKIVSRMFSDLISKLLSVRVDLSALWK